MGGCRWGGRCPRALALPPPPPPPPPIRGGEVEGGGRKGEGGEGIGLPSLPCPLTLSCPPNAEFLDPPMVCKL